MISADQPTIFDDSIMVVFSSRSDGSMLNRQLGRHAEQIVNNRQKFCLENGIDYDDVAYQRIVYSDNASYELMAEVDERSTTRYIAEIVGDGLFTRYSRVGLFLPVADCVATVLYDATRRYVALLHLGRHSTLSQLLTRTIEKFVDEGSQRNDIKVWMGPSAGRDSYRMDYFDHQQDPVWKGFFDVRSDGVYLDLSGYNRQVCIRAGIPSGNIEVSKVDTMQSPEYFSFADDGTADRMAALVYMR